MNLDTARERLRELGVEAEASQLLRSHRTTWREVFSRSRTAHISEARHAFALWLREKLAWSYPAIGAFLGRDHTTVMASCRKARAQRGDAGLELVIANFPELESERPPLARCTPPVMELAS